MAGQQYGESINLAAVELRPEYMPSYFTSDLQRMQNQGLRQLRSIHSDILRFERRLTTESATIQNQQELTRISELIQLLVAQRQTIQDNLNLIGAVLSERGPADLAYEQQMRQFQASMEFPPAAREVLPDSPVLPDLPDLGDGDFGILEPAIERAEEEEEEAAAALFELSGQQEADVGMAAAAEVPADSGEIELAPEVPPTTPEAAAPPQKKQRKEGPPKKSTATRDRSRPVPATAVSRGKKPTQCVGRLELDPGASEAWRYILRKNKEAVIQGKDVPFKQAINNLAELPQGPRRRMQLSGKTINLHIREVMNQVALARGHRIFPTQDVVDDDENHMTHYGYMSLKDSDELIEARASAALARELELQRLQQYQGEHSPYFPRQHPPPLPPPPPPPPPAPPSSSAAADIV